MADGSSRTAADGASGPIRVFGVDDHQGVLEGLRQIISDQSDLSWVGQASSIGDAQSRLAALRPDVMLLDSRLKSESGLDLCAWTRERLPEVRVLMLTGSTDAALLLQALAAGATGFLIKQARGRDIVDAIRRVRQGEVVWDVRMGQAVLQHFREVGGQGVGNERLERYRERVHSLYQGMTAIAGIRSVEEMLQRVLSLARELTGARYAALAVLLPDESIAQFLTEGLTPGEMRAMGALPRGKGLLGEVIHTRRPLRVNDIPSHPRASGWPPGHPPMRTFLGMPMLVHGEVVGHLYMTDKRGGEAFSAEDEELVGLLASLGAVLVKNQRLNEDLGRLAVVEERQRIGMNLHDGTLQTIYSVLLGLDALLGEMPEGSRTYDAVNRLAERLREVTDEIRRYVLDLKSDARPLMSTVEEIAQELGLGEKLRIHSSDMSYTQLPEETVEHLARFTQEALSNVARHAQATRVDVTWRRVGDEFQLMIDDDGVGFDTSQPSPPGHHGRRHLEERARLAGGRLQVDSRPHEGARILLTAPMPR